MTTRSYGLADAIAMTNGTITKWKHHTNKNKMPPTISRNIQNDHPLSLPYQPQPSALNLILCCIDRENRTIMMIVINYLILTLQSVV